MSGDDDAIAPLAVDRALSEIALLASRLHQLARSGGYSTDARCRAVVALEDEARATLYSLTTTLSAQVFAQASTSSRLLAAGRDVFGALLDAYKRCIRDSQDRMHRDRLPDCSAGLARAAAQRVIWERCCGGPTHEQLWRWLDAALRETIPAATDRADEEAAVAGNPGTAVEREYLRAVAAASAALELLPARLIMVVDRLFTICLPMLQLRQTPFAGATHYLDSSLPGGPRRIAGEALAPAPGIRFFSPRAAAAALREIADRLAAGDGSPGLARGDDGDASLSAALAHLLRHWSDTPPVRRFRRYLLQGRLSAVRGIEDLQRLFSGERGVPQTEWLLRDASRGGIGVHVPIAAGAAVRAGELVGLRAHDGDGWQLAVVRRTWITPGRYLLAGLETLSRNPVLARVDDGRSRIDVLLCDPLLRGEAVRITTPDHVLAPGAPLFVTRSGSIQKLKALAPSLAGDGFELLVYQVL